MITIDPLDDQVVQKQKPERPQSDSAQRLPRRSKRAGRSSETKTHSRLKALALRLLRGGTGEEE